MCDTLGRIGFDRSFFAKNSDRSPNEVQVLEYHPPRTGLSGDVNCTYITIPQADSTYGVLLSRPAWMWGAEIGVNEFGLCIGNEAVFTKGAYGKSGLTGMDLVRLALERCRTAKDALELTIQLLEAYGQGGNCGYDHKFYYDNAFLIMDCTALYVLETAGKQWVYKQYAQASISNRLSIGADGDVYSGGIAYDFRRKFTDPIYTGFSGSAKRQQQTGRQSSQASTLQSCLAALTSHDTNAMPFVKGSVSSACMHYGGLVGDHTTASMMVSLEKDRTIIWNTGCSLPCVSLFKPWLFGAKPTLPVVHSDDPAGAQYWMEAETFRRSLIGKEIPSDYYDQLHRIQQRWFREAETVSREDFPAFSEACLLQERAFFESWKTYPFPSLPCSQGFRGRWEKKNKALR